MDQQPWEGQATCDDFRSGTISAACGGTTTVIPFAMPLKGQSLRAVVDDYHRRATGKAVIDYAFHLVVADPSPQALGQDLPALMRDGCTSFKVYLTYEGLALSDEGVLNVLDFAKREGALVMVHAENDAVVRWLTNKLLAEGKTGIEHHLSAHPHIGDREATHRAISFSELMDVPILITHVSHREGAEQIRWAQTRGPQDLRARPARNISSSRPRTLPDLTMTTRWPAPNMSVPLPRGIRPTSSTSGKGCRTARSRCCPPTTRPIASPRR